MEQNKLIRVEVAYALPERQYIIPLDVVEGCTVNEAITLSGILNISPDIDLHKQPVGVFGKLRSLSDEVREGDRVEIYRPLAVDPKEARRRKEKNKK